MYKVLAYSLKEEGEVKVSENFKVKEFACNDGSDVVLVNPLTVWVLQNVRDHFGKPVYITSGYRTVAHNSKTQGASANSLHLFGLAVDFVVEGVAPKTVQEYLETVMPNTGGIGKASNYTHVDTRAMKSRWTY